MHICDTYQLQITSDNTCSLCSQAPLTVTAPSNGPRSSPWGLSAERNKEDTLNGQIPNSRRSPFISASF